MTSLDVRDLDPTVLRFIDRFIDSIPELEALLLLYESAPKAWNTPDLARRLYVYQEEAETILSKLRRTGLALGDETSGSSFNNDTREKATIQMLSETYRRHLTLLTRAVHAKAPRGIREFARAFDVKKDNM